MMRGLRRRAAPAPALALLAACWAQAASAHIQRAEAAGLLTGLLHPLSGLDHVLAMVAVGLWGAQLGMPAIWVLPVAFPLVMAMGGMLGFLGLPIPGVEVGIAASAIVLGMAVAFELRPPLVIAALVVGCSAIFHGHAHGTELPPGQSALLYSLGFVVATGCLHALGIGIGTVHSRPGGRQLLRAAGAAVSAGGHSSCGGRAHEVRERLVESCTLARPARPVWPGTRVRASGSPPQCNRDGPGL